MRNKDIKLHDRVHSERWGNGTVVYIDEKGDILPLLVLFDNKSHYLHDGLNSKKTEEVSKTYDLENRCYWCSVEEEDIDIDTYCVVTPLRAKSTEEEEEVEDKSPARVIDDVNPSYYNVEGASQPIEDMEALMTPEQFEGFLWGNIIKYTKRFGRKGDKVLTLGKIIWYADRLKKKLESDA